MQFCHGLLSAGLIVLSASPGAAAPPRDRPEPVKGVVYGGAAIAVRIEDTKSDDGRTAAYVALIKESFPVVKKVPCSFCNVLPPRWHVGHGAFWIAEASSLTGVLTPNNTTEQIHRYEMGQLLKGRAITGAGVENSENEWLNWDPFAGAWPVTHARGLASNYVAQVYYDWLPAGTDRVKLLVLTNLRGHYRPAAETELLSARIVEQSEEEMDHPKWSLTVHAGRSLWDAKALKWDNGTWSREGTIAVGFREPFQVLARGETYYFVTSSGKVYAAPKAEQGKERPMTPVWTDAERPVTVFIEDADAGRTFLFCKPATKGAKGVYFELAEKAEPLPYDPQALPRATADEPLRTVLRCARFLVGEGKIKAK